jgi:hypothetical protein
MASDVTTPSPETAPLLRTLAPALRGLERSLRGWLDAPHSYPLSTINRATLEGLANDLHRHADALDVDRPLLVVMLMGGTGVGKSTLLNALAGGNIAQASFARPTTRDPVVYYHESVRPERLDPALRHCRLAPHDRPGLEHKIIVDTPDLDSNDLANRDKLERVLPVADVVLYVGSQEKYHDKLGWDLFLKQRRRRAFAFVLNKWDRCLHALTSGMRPDEDLLRDLRSEGFDSPLLFRTCAQLWLDAAGQGQGWWADGAAGNGAAVENEPRPATPEGEQFLDLVRWLEMGLTRLEIEAIKARGVSQMLAHLEQALTAAAPPELTEVAERTRAAWVKPLTEEAATAAGVLLDTVEPYQKEIEHHFALEGQRRFHGLMAAYLRFTTRWRYGSASARWRVPLLPRLTTARAEPTPAAWDLANFTRACSDVAGNRHLDARIKALANRLLVDADAQGFPLTILSEPVESRTALDWRQRYSQILVEVLHQVEQDWTQPKGFRLVMQSLVIFIANWLPPLALLAGILVLLWRIIDPAGHGYNPHWTDVLLPVIVLVAVLVLLHVVIALLLPFRWAKIRGEFARKLDEQLRQELENVYEPIPGEIAVALRTERRQVEKVLSEAREVASWLQAREKSASIEGLYGH